MTSKIPSNCGKCAHIGNYTHGLFARNPHHCCELIWELFEEDYRVNPKELDENCPLLNEDFRKGIQAIEKCRILKNKQVDICRLKESNTEKEYNDGIILSYGYSLGCNLFLTPEEFEVLKEK